jgi:hypothetical protein
VKLPTPGLDELGCGFFGFFLIIVLFGGLVWLTFQPFIEAAWFLSQDREEGVAKVWQEERQLRREREWAVFIRPGTYRVDMIAINGKTNKELASWVQATYFEGKFSRGGDNTPLLGFGEHVVVYPKGQPTAFRLGRLDDGVLALVWNNSSLLYRVFAFGLIPALVIFLLSLALVNLAKRRVLKEDGTSKP